MEENIHVTEPSHLETLLQARLGKSVQQLHIVAQEDGIVLTGWAISYYAKQLVQQGAMQLSGLPILANDIEVR